MAYAADYLNIKPGASQSFYLFFPRFILWNSKVWISVFFHMQTFVSMLGVYIFLFYPWALEIEGFMGHKFSPFKRLFLSSSNAVPKNIFCPQYLTIFLWKYVFLNNINFSIMFLTSKIMNVNLRFAISPFILYIFYLISNSQATFLALLY